MAIGGTTRYSCPLDGCRWYYDEVAQVSPFGNSRPNTKITNLLGVRDETEQELERHLDTHPRADFLVTIQNLRQQLEGRLLTP